MRGFGTILNVITVLIGGSIGLAIGTRFSKVLHTTVMNVNGMITIVIGAQMAFKSSNILIVLACLLIGTVIGELIDIDKYLLWLSEYLEKKFSKGEKGVFAKGFLTASLLFCVGPMTILGSIQDGLTGDYTLLATKSVLDGFTSIAFAAAMGVGVLFTILTIIVVQGGLTILAGLVSGIMTDAVITELTAVGGVMIISLGLGMLEIKKIKTANILPSLVIVPLVVFIIGLFSIK